MVCSMSIVTIFCSACSAVRSSSSSPRARLLAMFGVTSRSTFLPQQDNDQEKGWLDPSALGTLWLGRLLVGPGINRRLLHVTTNVDPASSPPSTMSSLWNGWQDDRSVSLQVALRYGPDRLLVAETSRLFICDVAEFSSSLRYVMFPNTRRTPRRCRWVEGPVKRATS